MSISEPLSDIHFRVRRAAKQRRHQPPKRERLELVAAQMRAKATPAARAQRLRRTQERLTPQEQWMTRMALARMEPKPEQRDRPDRETLLGLPRDHAVSP